MYVYVCVCTYYVYMYTKLVSLFTHRHTCNSHPLIPVTRMILTAQWYVCVCMRMYVYVVLFVFVYDMTRTFHASTHIQHTSLGSFCYTLGHTNNIHIYIHT